MKMAFASAYVVLIGLAACSQPAPQATSAETSAGVQSSVPPVATLAAANSTVKTVSVDNAVVTVMADLGDAMDDEGMINNAAVVAYDIGRHVKDGAQEAAKAKTVKIVYTTDLTDKYGNKSNGTVLTVAFLVDDLRRVNYANLGAREVMNLATDKRVLSPAMAGVAKWCQDNGDHAPDFCRF